MTEFYSPGQLSVIYPFLTFEPKWLLLGGPADANEAQTAREKWPDIQIVGVEPNREAIAFQKANGWPKDAPLLCGGLSESDYARMPFINTTGSLRHQRVDIGSAAFESPLQAHAVSWDRIDSFFGPFNNAILWMDIEGWELYALWGAKKLFDRNAIRLVNVEMQSEFETRNRDLEAWMERYEFKAVHEWNNSPSCWDRIYVK